MNVTRVRPLQGREWRQGTYLYGTQVETWPALYRGHHLGVEKRNQPERKTSPSVSRLGEKNADGGTRSSRDFLNDIHVCLDLA